MKHLDLFSGIGGFHLAGEMVWGDEFNTIAHVEIDSFCQKVLKKHWPSVPIISDIKEYKNNGTEIDLLTGGFPCQPFSCAGKQRGKEDDRYLWPEMLRVISEVRPTWIIGENVAGIINLGLDQVLSDLENTGYACQAFIVPACAQNAPHRRDRVWIIANAINRRSQERWAKNDKEMGKSAGHRKASMLISAKASKSDSHASGFKNKRMEGRNTERTGCSGGRNTEYIVSSEWENKSESWQEPWIEAATRLCRVDDGVSRQMDRVNRLKALGNAIVPQAVVPIMQTIKTEMEKCKYEN